MATSPPPPRRKSLRATPPTAITILPSIRRFTPSPPPQSPSLLGSVPSYSSPNANPLPSFTFPTGTRNGGIAPTISPGRSSNASPATSPPRQRSPRPLPSLKLEVDKLSRRNSAQSGISVRSGNSTGFSVHGNGKAGMQSASEDEASRMLGGCVGSNTEDIHPLKAEIERLSLLCDQHELKFRASKASFEHRVFSEFPSILARLGELDSRAERITGDLYATINEAVPALKHRLRTMKEQRAEDVAKMRERTTPWADFMHDDDEEDEEVEPLVNGDPAAANGVVNEKQSRSDRKTGKGHASASLRARAGCKIERVRGAGAEIVSGDALAMIERWAEEVEMHLAEEIVRLKAQLGEGNRKRLFMARGMLAGFLIVIIIALAWWLRRFFFVPRLPALRELPPALHLEM